MNGNAEWTKTNKKVRRARPNTGRAGLQRWGPASNAPRPMPRVQCPASNAPPWPVRYWSSAPKAAACPIV